MLRSNTKRLTTLCVSQTTADSSPGRLYGGTTGRREHGPHWTNGWSALQTLVVKRFIHGDFGDRLLPWLDLETTTLNSKNHNHSRKPICKQITTLRSAQHERLIRGLTAATWALVSCRGWTEGTPRDLHPADRFQVASSEGLENPAASLRARKKCCEPGF